MAYYTLIDGVYLGRTGVSCHADIKHLRLNDGEEVVWGEIQYPPQPETECRYNTVTKQWEDTPIPYERLLSEAKYQQRRRLAETDWMVVREFDTGQPMPSEWKEYRQALRDITDNITFPVAWPEPPSTPTT